MKQSQESANFEIEILAAGGIAMLSQENSGVTVSLFAG
jgi:hypothetical protein